MSNQDRSALLSSAGLNQIVLLWVIHCQVEVFLCEAPASTAYLLEFVRGRPLIAFREISGFQPSLPELGGQNGKDSPSGFLLSTSAIACSASRSICSTAATCLRCRAGNCTRCGRHSVIRLVPLDGFGTVASKRLRLTQSATQSSLPLLGPRTGIRCCSRPARSMAVLTLSTHFSRTSSGLLRSF